MIKTLQCPKGLVIGAAFTGQVPPSSPRPLPTALIRSDPHSIAADHTLGSPPRLLGPPALYLAALRSGPGRPTISKSSTLTETTRAGAGLR